jgi:hypothetical protein
MSSVEERLAQLETTVDLIGRATAELGLQAVPEADPLNPSFGSANVKARIQRHAANISAVIARYVDTRYSQQLEAFVRERDAARREVHKYTDEEAAEVNRRLARTHTEAPGAAR